MKGGFGEVMGAIAPFSSWLHLWCKQKLIILATSQ